MDANVHEFTYFSTQFMGTGVNCGNPVPRRHTTSANDPLLSFNSTFNLVFISCHAVKACLYVLFFCVYFLLVSSSFYPTTEHVSLYRITFRPNSLYRHNSITLTEPDQLSWLHRLSVSSPISYHSIHFTHPIILFFLNSPSLMTNPSQRQLRSRNFPGGHTKAEGSNPSSFQ